MIKANVVSKLKTSESFQEGYQRKNNAISKFAQIYMSALEMHKNAVQ